MQLKTFTPAEVTQKTVLLRVDYNVPLKNGAVSDNTRIVESLETINILLHNQARIILMSHLGRPEGVVKPDLSLSPVALELSKLLGKEVIFLKDCRGPEVKTACAQMQPGQIILLENLRFHPEEESNDPTFSQELASLGQIYINDAFGTAHRAHASTYGITKFIPSFAGRLIEKEIANLDLLFNTQKHPYTLVIGGAKIDTKIEIINNFIKRADNFIFGGGIANTFLAAQEKFLGASLVELEKIGTAKEILRNIISQQKPVFLPEDFVVATEISDTALTKNLDIVTEPGQKVLDIGSKSQQSFAEILEKSQIIVWNGPMGVYENSPFRTGTKRVAEAIIKATEQGAISILGGGDTIDALKVIGLSNKQFTHVSTGGGAMLEYLEKGTLPGLEVLKK